MSTWRSNLVNLNQSPEERRAKYVFLRRHGKNTAWSVAMRDWRWSKIYRCLGIKEVIAKQV